MRAPRHIGSTMQSVRTYHLPPVHDWDDWRPIFTDSALWRPLIGEIWAADSTLPAVTGVEMPTRVEAGYPGTCAVFVVNRKVVVKLFPPMLPHDLEKERIVHRLLKRDGLHIPAMLAEGMIQDRRDWPYLILAYVPGVAWRDCVRGLKIGEQINMLQALGEIIRAVHGTPLPPAGDWPSLDDWQRLIDTRLPHVADELRQQTALSSRIIEEIGQWLSSIDWPAFRPCLCHADLTEDHLLLSQESGQWQIGGLIDWADAEVAPPLYEWVTLWFSLCRRQHYLLDAFLAGYDGSLSTEVSAGQMLAFTFLHRFGAAMLNEVLSPEEQRAVGNLKELEQQMFPRLPG